MATPPAGPANVPIGCWRTRLTPTPAPARQCALKQFRDLTTRYAKCAAYYRSELIIASLVLWLRMDLQDTA